MRRLLILLVTFFALPLGAEQASYKFGVNQALPPFSYSEGQDQKGLAIEMARKVFETAGINAQIVPMEWAQAQAMVKTGQLDGLININKTEERAKWLLFTGSFLKGDFHFFTRENHEFTYRSMSDLEGKRVAVERHGFVYNMLKDNDSIDLQGYELQSLAMTAVNDRVADVYIGDVVVTEYLTRRGEAPRLAYHPEPFSEVASRIAIHPQHQKLVDDLNGALEKIRTTGEYQQIYAKWDRETVDFLGERQQNIIYLSIAGAIAMLCLLAFLREHKQRLRISNAVRQTEKSLSETLEAKKEKEDALRQLLISSEEKEKALNEAIRAREDKDKFIAQITHEFRTPLNTIYGTVKLLKPKDEETLEAANKIKRATKHLVSMTSNILIWEKSLTGNIKPVRHIYSLRSLLNELGFSAALSAEATQNEWTCQIPRSIPDLLVCDHRLLKHCLENLLDNAFKHCTQGQVSLLVEQTETTLEFIVADNGVGIPAGKLEKMTGAYYDSSGYENNRNTRGLGLGLAVARKLAEAMGGTLNMASEQGTGTLVQLSIPLLVPGESDIADFQQAQTLLEQRNNKVLMGYNILVVDDHLLNLEINANLLESLGATVYCASSSKAAEKLIAEQLEKQCMFDVIFMDLQMPEIDGFESVRRIRKQHPSTQFHFVALTACDHKGLIGELEQIGIHEVLHKPFETEDAVRLVLQSGAHSLSLTEGILSNIKEDSRY